MIKKIIFFRQRRRIRSFTFDSLLMIYQYQSSMHMIYASSMELIHNYLTNRYQEVKMNNAYNVFNLIKYGAPLGSILGPIRFNILLCDLFLIVLGIDF